MDCSLFYGVILLSFFSVLFLWSTMHVIVHVHVASDIYSKRPLLLAYNALHFLVVCKYYTSMKNIFKKCIGM